MIESDRSFRGRAIPAKIDFSLRSQKGLSCDRKRLGTNDVVTDALASSEDAALTRAARHAALPLAHVGDKKV
jgi:hypothetical protein